MQRYRHFSMPSLLFEIMNSEVTWPCLCCSARLQRTRSRVPAPWDHIGTFLWRAEGHGANSLHQCPFPNRVDQTMIYWSSFHLEHLREPLAVQAQQTGTHQPELSHPVASIPVSSFPLRILPLLWLPLSIQHSKSYYYAFYVPFVWISLSLL